MKINKPSSDRCNISGTAIKNKRKELGLSQEALAAQIQLLGLPLSQKAISRIESGSRVVADYELILFSEVLHVSLDELLYR